MQRLHHPRRAQSSFDRPFHRSYNLADTEESTHSNEESTARSLQRSPSARSVSLVAEERRDAAERAELEVLHTVGSIIHSSQIPLWLTTTNTKTFLHSLVKEEMHRVISAPAYDDEECYYVIISIVHSCLQSTSGKVLSDLNRVTARKFNSFGPSRMQSKPFVPVREKATLKRDARSWSMLTIYLLRMQSIQNLEADDESGSDANDIETLSHG